VAEIADAVQRLAVADGEVAAQSRTRVGLVFEARP
jgi:hypothetical protein